MQIKYVMFDDIFPVIFTEAMGHDEVKWKGKTPTSAGFCSINTYDRVVTAYGKSISLNMTPHPDDDIFLTKFIFGD